MIPKAAGRPTTLLAGLIVMLAASGCGPASEPGASAITFPGGPGSGQARLTSDTDGTPIISWLEPDGEFDVLRFARYQSGGFDSAHDVVRSDRMFVNYADFPSVTPITDTLWFAHWLKRQPDKYTYDIATMVSRDGGASWADAEQMNEDQTEAEHGFVSVFNWDDAIAAFWLDGRELANWSFDEPDALLGVSLRFARFDMSGKVTERVVTDELVCDCCQPDVAVAGGRPIVVYRDRTESEIRDVVARRWLGDGWSEPVDLGDEGWHIEACPVNGPVVAASATNVAAAWFTAADNRPRVRMARSDDAGVSFSTGVDVDTKGALGQPGIAVDDDGRAVVSWWRRGSKGGIDLMVRAYERDGRVDGELTVAHEAIGQAVDVPQLIAAGDGYLIAWTSLEGDGTVRTARLTL